MKTLLLLFLILPGISQAQIFRCDAKGETYFSQIPCTDSSETVLIEDQLMFSEEAPAKDVAQEKPETSAEPVKSQAENMREFVWTLQRQRTEQLQQIDRDIGTLAVQLDAIGDAPADSEKRRLLDEQLTTLQTSRGSIVEQYETMIAEAERRVAALSNQNAVGGDRLN